MNYDVDHILCRCRIIIIMTRRLPSFVNPYFSNFYAPCDFPKTDTLASKDINFLPWARTHPFDLIITNGRVEFQAHRRIIALFSVVMAHILESDHRCKSIKVSMDDYVMKLFQQSIYTHPSNRQVEDYDVKIDPDFTIANWQNLLESAAKYD
eukprot:UN09260